MNWNTDIFFRKPVRARPLPCFVEHLPVQLSYVFVRRHSNRAGAVLSRPFPGEQYVLPLPFIQLLLCEIGDEGASSSGGSGVCPSLVVAGSTIKRKFTPLKKVLNHF